MAKQKDLAATTGIGERNAMTIEVERCRGERPNLMSQPCRDFERQRLGQDSIGGCHVTQDGQGRETVTGRAAVTLTGLEPSSQTWPCILTELTLP